MNASDHECRDLTSPRGKPAASELGGAYRLPGKVVDIKDVQVYSSTPVEAIQATAPTQSSRAVLQKE
jgi:hypothetical protein